MKICSLCKKEQPFSNFYPNTGTKDGFGSWCRGCDKIQQRIKKKKRKETCVKYLGGKCKLCGYSRCLQALDFHHKNPKEKDFGISGNKMDWTKIKNELDKCVLLCANCHREEHERIASLVS